MSRNLGVSYTDKKPYYFISYNSEDELKVSKYAKELEKYGIPMWYDSGIKIGIEWETEIAERIENCCAVIMFLSSSIFLKDNSYVHKEFELATEYSNKKVYVMMLDEIKKPDVPVRFRSWWTNVTRLQCVNTYEYDSPDTCVKRLIESIDYNTPAAMTPSHSNHNSNGIFSRINYKDGTVYEGFAVDNVRNGKGKLVWVDGTVYEGDFADDEITGKGKIIFASGNVYEGDFVNGVFSGKGKLMFADGNVYEGDFVNGEFSGKGKLMFANGDVYEGDFVNGYFSGKGMIIFADGNVYEGDFVNGEFSGKGKYVWMSGDVYEGDFVDGIRTGKGKYVFANGDVYIGDFVDGEITCGVLYDKNGNIKKKYGSDKS